MSKHAALSKCKYCGEQFPKRGNSQVCSRCVGKSSLLPLFVKARDDVREAFGLERMGEKQWKHLSSPGV